MDAQKGITIFILILLIAYFGAIGYKIFSNLDTFKENSKQILKNPKFWNPFGNYDIKDLIDISDDNQTGDGDGDGDDVVDDGSDGNQAGLTCIPDTTDPFALYYQYNQEGTCRPYCDYGYMYDSYLNQCMLDVSQPSLEDGEVCPVGVDCTPTLSYNVEVSQIVENDGGICSCKIISCTPGNTIQINSNFEEYCDLLPVGSGCSASTVGVTPVGFDADNVSSIPNGVIKEKNGTRYCFPTSCDGSYVADWNDDNGDGVWDFECVLLPDLMQNFKDTVLDANFILKMNELNDTLDKISEYKTSIVQFKTFCTDKIYENYANGKFFLANENYTLFNQFFKDNVASGLGELIEDLDEIINAVHTIVEERITSSAITHQTFFDNLFSIVQDTDVWGGQDFTALRDKGNNYIVIAECYTGCGIPVNDNKFLFVSSSINATYTTLINHNSLASYMSTTWGDFTAIQNVGVYKGCRDWAVMLMQLDDCWDNCAIPYDYNLGGSIERDNHALLIVQPSLDEQKSKTVSDILPVLYYYEGSLNHKDYYLVKEPLGSSLEEIRSARYSSYSNYFEKMADPPFWSGTLVNADDNYSCIKSTFINNGAFVKNKLVAAGGPFNETGEFLYSMNGKYTGLIVKSGCTQHMCYKKFDQNPDAYYQLPGGYVYEVPESFPTTTTGLVISSDTRMKLLDSTDTLYRVFDTPLFSRLKRFYSFKFDVEHVNKGYRLPRAMKEAFTECAPSSEYFNMYRTRAQCSGGRSDLPSGTVIYKMKHQMPTTAMMNSKGVNDPDHWFAQFLEGDAYGAAFQPSNLLETSLNFYGPNSEYDQNLINEVSGHYSDGYLRFD